MTRTTRLIAAGAAVVVLSAGAGFVGGYFAPHPPSQTTQVIAADGCWRYHYPNRQTQPNPNYNVICLAKP